jgi:hypothetical protein
MAVLIRAGIKVAEALRDRHHETDEALTDVLMSDRQAAPLTSATAQAQVPARELETGGTRCARTQQMRLRKTSPGDEMHTVTIMSCPTVYKIVYTGLKGLCMTG